MDGAFCFKSGTHLSRLIDETGYITHELESGQHRQAVTSLIDETPTNENGYARQLIHADPAEKFSVLALRWLPGAATPIHGHHAWGCVGVVNGEIGCETYAHKPGVVCDSEHPHPDDLVSTGKLLAGPGTVAGVDPDPCGIHRLFNPTNSPALTLHIYGMNFAKDPDGLNKYYQH
jgi:predicted metal-dependent enzyme (double-stranded beta helix superfamily)